MPGNTIGQLFRVTTFGESHGIAMGCIVDGCPANFELAIEDIQFELDRRRPGQSHYTSQRREADTVEILAGVFAGKTTGAPIALLIKNTDARSSDYSEIKDKFRPGHGDYTYQAKYGIRDYRGGGRASARETVARVAAGAIAKKFLWQNCDLKIQAVITQIGNIIADPVDINASIHNEFNFADATKLDAIADLITELRREGDSIGAQVHLIASNVPVGLGEPVFDKLNADLAHAWMSINAVKGVAIGAGFNCVTARGSEFRDEIYPENFASNNAGGILAGISTGQDITANIAFKPASSIRIPAATVDTNNNPTTIVTMGRHDPCVAIRAVAIVEAMTAIVLMDHLLRQRGQNGYLI
jgi:chorismate synthase